MKIVFFGTPDYVVDILESLHKRFKNRDGKSPIVAVITQGPKPAGRKKILTYSPVDKWAYDKKIPVLYKSRELIENNIKADVGVLESYGEILPKEIINYFPHGILNVHPSLLPRWRGASPVQATLVAADKETGGTTIRLDEKVDHGPIVSQFKEEILPTDTTGTLRARIFARSADVLSELLEPYIKGKIKLRPQEGDKATFSTLIKKEDGFIPGEVLQATVLGKKFKKKFEVRFIKNYSLLPTPNSLERFIRAMDPWPRTWTKVNILSNKDTKILRLKILKAHIDKDRLVLDEVQLEGKNPVSWEQFKEAYPNSSL